MLLRIFFKNKVKKVKSKVFGDTFDVNIMSKTALLPNKKMEIKSRIYFKVPIVLRLSVFSLYMGDLQVHARFRIR